MRRRLALSACALLIASGCARSRGVDSDAGIERDGALPDGALADAPDAADGSTTPEEIRAYLEELADAQCQRAIRCESVSILAPRPFCHPGWVEDMAAAFSAGTIDIERAAACLAAFDAPCDVDALVPNCGLDAISGVGTTGDPCRLDETCADDHFCAPSSCPTCRPRVGLGSSCTWHSGCDPALVCDTGSSRRCLRPRSFGETCGSDDLCLGPLRERGVCDGVCRFAREGEVCGADEPTCGPELWCDTRAGVCRALGRDGDPCRASNGHCAADHVCSDGGICRAPEGLEGALCRSHDQCPPEAPYCAGVPGRCSASARDVRCTTDAECGQGGWCAGGFRCAARAELGGACDATTLCPEGAQCVATGDGDRCLAIAGPGSACGDERVCVLGFGCRDGRCEPLPMQGQPCEDACALGVCRDGACAPQEAGEPCEAVVVWPYGSSMDAASAMGRQCTGACSSTFRDDRGVCIAPTATGEPCGVCARGDVCGRVDEEFRCTPLSCE